MSLTKEVSMNLQDKKELLMELRKKYESAKEAQASYIKGGGFNPKMIIKLSKEKVKAQYVLDAVTEKIRKEGNDI